VQQALRDPVQAHDTVVRHARQLAVEMLVDAELVHAAAPPHLIG
jgi:hypothetical protein